MGFLWMQFEAAEKTKALSFNDEVSCVAALADNATDRTIMFFKPKYTTKAVSPLLVSENLKLFRYQENPLAMISQTITSHHMNCTLL